MNPKSAALFRDEIGLLKRMFDFEERRRDGLPIHPNDERILRMDVREALGITGEGEPWLQS